MKVALISLGCAKNLVDSEIVLGALLREGMELTTEPADADILLVNTCSFIESAQEESINTILEMANRPERSRQAIIVTGCLPQRFPDELPGLIPEVDAFLGVDQISEVAGVVEAALEHRKTVLDILKTTKQGSKKHPIELPPPPLWVNRKPTYIHNAKTPRLPLTPKHFVYIKVAEGCNHSCAFCAIPQIRGRYRSRKVDDILNEARAAIKGGCREINLISQDTTRYGVDLKDVPEGTNTAAYLLKKAAALRGDFWVRLLYTHPAYWNDELISVMAKAKKAVHYVDIPLQHIHPVMLERMGRRTSPEHIRTLLKKIKDAMPDVTLRTTFIVGYPGETEEYFETLLDFVREYRFQKVGAFTFSAQEGTRAATMSGTVAENVKRKRLDKLMRLQREISLSNNRKQVGMTKRVLIERAVTEEDWDGAFRINGESGQTRGNMERMLPFAHDKSLRKKFYVGRGTGDAPDVDGRVYVFAEPGVRVGEFANVTITDAREYDLIGTLCDAGEVSCK